LAGAIEVVTVAVLGALIKAETEAVLEVLILVKEMYGRVKEMKTGETGRTR